MTTESTPPVPAACTLPTPERPARLAEWGAQLAAAVRRDRPTPRHARLTLPGAADRAAQLRDLAARESRCCSFFDFTVTGAPDGTVTLDIRVPAAQVAILDALLAPGDDGQVPA